MNQKSITNLCYFCSVTTFNSGMPISTFKLIQHFSADPHYKVFCIFPSDGELPQRVRACGAHVTIIPFHRIRKGFAITNSLMSWLVTVVRFALFLKKNQIHIVHFSDLIDLPYYPSALLSGSRCCAHIRMNIENAPLRLFFKIWATLFCDTIICISDSVKKYAGLQSNPRAVIVYNPGPDLQLFNSNLQLPIPDGLHGSKSNIVLIANFRAVKGHEHFIRLASLVECQLPDKCHYCIVGDRLPAHLGYYTMIHQLIDENNLSSKFSILEGIKHETIPSILQHTFVLVHVPNYQEGFGGVILEAMNMGTPVIAFRSGGVPECFTHNVSGFLVDQYKPQQAADALLKLLRNPLQRNEMGSEAQNEVRKFSYSRHFSEINQVYGKITG